MVYQKYCEEMHKLSLLITELLATSLGVKRSYYRDFYEDAHSIMRLNYYPPCDEPNLVLGTGPHCDPTSLTVLYQDEVEGLEVFVNNKWHAIEPRRDALVINIGDTLMVRFLITSRRLLGYMILCCCVFTRTCHIEIDIYLSTI